MRSSREENVSEHTLETAYLAAALAEIGNAYFNREYDTAQIALKAIFHDAPEVFTGDLPSPIKYRTDDLREAYKQIERDSEEALLSKLPDEMRVSFRQILTIGHDSDEGKLIKAADKLSAYIKCVEERISGNRDFLEAERELCASLGELNLPELKYFTDNFLPSFGLTIDELK
ncbi:5'-deoxynucleotidase [Clostridia bacterium]|nr:5'-deoxynucleotidase [Clostridia bacterium]